MTDSRVERAADALIAADQAGAAIASRQGKGGRPPEIAEFPEIADVPDIAKTPAPTSTAGEPTITPQIDLTDGLRPDAPEPSGIPSSGPDPELEEAIRREEEERQRWRKEGWDPAMGWPTEEDKFEAAEENERRAEIADRDDDETDERTEALDPAVALDLLLPDSMHDDDDDDHPLSTSGPANAIAEMLRTYRLLLIGIIIAFGLAGVALLIVFGDLGSSVSPTPSPTSSPSPSPEETAPPPECPEVAAMETLPGLSPADQSLLCDVFDPDPTNDGIEYDGSPASIEPDRGDFVATGIFEVTLTPEAAAALAAQCSPAGKVQCRGTPPAAGVYTVWGIQTAQTIDPAATAFYEMGIGILDSMPPVGTPLDAYQGGPGDVFNGNNVVYTIRMPSVANGGGVFGPFELAYQGQGKAPPFFEQTSGTFAYLSGNVLLGFTPAAEWTGVMTYRFFSYYAIDGTSDAAVDLAPDPGEPPVSAPVAIPVIDVR